MIEMSNCTADPYSIMLGGQTNLKVTLTAPAPPGGVTVIIEINSGDAQDTLVEIPQSIGITQGSWTAAFLVRTQAVDGAATQITFIAHLGSSQRSATLNIT